MFLAPEWLDENTGKHTVCSSCGESCGVIGQKEAVKNVPCTGTAGGKGREAYGLSFLWRALYEREAEQRGRAYRMAECTEKEWYEWLVLS